MDSANVLAIAFGVIALKLYSMIAIVLFLNDRYPPRGSEMIANVQSTVKMEKRIAPKSIAIIKIDRYPVVIYDRY